MCQEHFDGVTFLPSSSAAVLLGDVIPPTTRQRTHGMQWGALPRRSFLSFLNQIGFQDEFSG
jgi:hypothetical protein